MISMQKQSISLRSIGSSKMRGVFRMDDPMIRMKNMSKDNGDGFQFEIAGFTHWDWFICVRR